MITCAKGLTNGAMPDGRGARAQGHLRRLHGRRPRTRSSCSTATPIRPSASPARPASPTLDIYKEEGLFERAARARRAIGKTRCTRSRACRMSSTCATSACIAGIELEPIAGQADGARLRGVPQVLREGPADPHHRRHHRAVAAADRGEEPYRPDLRHARRGAEEAVLEPRPD